MSLVVKSGQGWRIGWNPNADVFKGLVGGDDWAIELTEAELNDFCRLVEQLAQTMNQIAGELMDEEKITCEAGSDLVWMEAKGYPYAYSFHFILHTGRRGEGGWPVEVVPQLVQTLRVFQVF